MQIRSYGSVKVIYLDRATVLEATGKSILTLAAQRPEVLKVVLFGSMARGDAVPGSDVDLLVILSASDRPFLDRLSWYRPSGVPVGVDVFPYTEDEFNKMLKEGNGLVSQAISEGTVLFDRADGETLAAQSNDHEGR